MLLGWYSERSSGLRAGCCASMRTGMETAPAVNAASQFRRVITAITLHLTVRRQTPGLYRDTDLRVRRADDRKIPPSPHRLLLTRACCPASCSSYRVNPGYEEAGMKQKKTG